MSLLFRTLALLVARSLLLGLLAVPMTVPSPTLAGDGCRPEPVTANTPTGIAGCVRSGQGLASHYGPGWGVAMNDCTWTTRHTVGCPDVTITSLQTGLSVTVPVVDFCDCYTGTANERVVDLLWDVVAALGLDRSQGLYPVVVTRGAAPAPPAPAVAPAVPATAASIPAARPLTALVLTVDVVAPPDPPAPPLAMIDCGARSLGARASLFELR